jgi:hypothetical protein
LIQKEIETFKDIIITQNPDHIIGIAAFRTTQFESKAINQFNKSKTVSVKGKDSYNLSIPKIGCKIHKSAYDSFCNWSSYKVSEFVDKWGLSSQVSFLHCTLEDNVMIKKLVISF